MLTHFCKLKEQGGGSILEFGVFKGTTINHIAEKCPNKTVYGFDSFEGLPEPWEIRKDLTYEKGYFNLNGEMPAVSPNVKLVKGLFEDTLPKWIIENKNMKVDILHIDSDLYSSAKTVLFNLNSMLTTETIIIFDELLRGNYYHLWENGGEWKAMNEWQTNFGRKLFAIGKTRSAEAAIGIEN